MTFAHFIIKMLLKFQTSFTCSFAKLLIVSRDRLTGETGTYSSRLNRLGEHNLLTNPDCEQDECALRTTCCQYSGCGNNYCSWELQFKCTYTKWWYCIDTSFETDHVYRLAETNSSARFRQIQPIGYCRFRSYFERWFSLIQS